MFANYTYLAINVFTILVPLLFIAYPRLPSLLVIKKIWKAYLTAGLGFIIWDVVVTYYGHWSFNPDFVTGIKIINLPIEEVLFFICIPFSSLYLYEILNKFVSDKLLNIHNNFFILVGVLTVILSLIFFNQQHYTLIIMIVFCFALVLSALKSQMLRSRNFWMFQAGMLGPFILVNGFLTSLPVVIYNSTQITNIRIGTIPVEDFIYSFSLLTLYLLAYTGNFSFSKNKLSIRFPSKRQ